MHINIEKPVTSLSVIRFPDWKKKHEKNLLKREVNNRVNPRFQIFTRPNKFLFRFVSFLTPRNVSLQHQETVELKQQCKQATDFVVY